MEIGSKEWKDFIVDGAKTFSIEVDQKIATQFANHALELLKWNQRINLTAITNSRGIGIRHFLDSLAPAHLIPPNAKMLDIGSGGGFPGIPLKILKSSLSVVLIDGMRKKVNFLKHVIRILKLENIDAHQIHAQNIVSDPAYIHSFEVIIGRAVSALLPFIRTALPLLAEKGIIIALQGQVNQKKLDALRSDILKNGYTLELETYRLPSIRAERSIVIVRSVHSTL
jgi:16S rRNA (guanine527-N7)-methyltransferase